MEPNLKDLGSKIKQAIGIRPTIELRRMIANEYEDVALRKQIIEEAGTDSSRISKVVSKVFFKVQDWLVERIVKTDEILKERFKQTNSDGLKKHYFSSKAELEI